MQSIDPEHVFESNGTEKQGKLGADKDMLAMS